MRLYGLSLLVIGLVPIGCATQVAWQIKYDDFQKPSQELTPLLLPESLLQSHTPPGFVKAVLPNGLRVSLLPDPQSSIVALRLFYRVGDAHEDAATRGLAHLVEHLLFGPTQSHQKGEYDEVVHRYGGFLNAHTYMDQTTYEADIVPSQVQAALQFEADRMRNVVFSQQLLEREKKIVVEELRMRYENQPTQHLIRSVQNTLANGHPYGELGTPSSVEAITLDQVQTFYERYYTPSNAHLIVVGPIEAEPLLALIRKQFGPLVAHNAPIPWVPPLVQWQFPRSVVFPQALLPVKIAILGFPLPPLSDQDTPALLLLNNILLTKKPNFVQECLVSSQKKAVEADVGMFLYPQGGFLYAYAAYLPYRRQQTAFQWLSQCFDRLHSFQWLTPGNLQFAKRSKQREGAFHRYSAAQQAEDIGWSTVWYQDPRYAFAYLSILEKVTLEDVRQVAEKYLFTQEPIQIYAVPTKVPWWIRGFGWLYPVVAKRQSDHLLLESTKEKNQELP